MFDEDMDINASQTPVYMLDELGHGHKTLTTFFNDTLLCSLLSKVVPDGRQAWSVNSGVC